jgi:hypothetical protein
MDVEYSKDNFVCNSNNVFVSQVMTIRTTKIGISIPTEIFEAIENIRTKSNRSKFVLELLLPELNRRMRPVE